jgi:hypothetical protein
MVGTLTSAKLDLAYEEVKAKVLRINDVHGGNRPDRR